MAEVYEAAKKTFGKLEQATDKHLGQYRMHVQSRRQLTDLLFETAKEVGRVAGELRAAGATGNDYAAFEKAPEMADVRKVVRETEAALLKEEQRLIPLHKLLLADEAGLEALQTELKDEVDVRTRKKERLLSIDSKSLPKIKQLLVTLDRYLAGVGTAYFVAEERDPAPVWTAARQHRLFLNLVQTELQKVPAAIRQQTAAELHAHRLDTRIFHRESSHVVQLLQRADDACADAQLSVRASGTARGDKNLLAARDAYLAAVKAFAPWRKRIEDQDARQLAQFTAQKEGKAIKDFVDRVTARLPVIQKKIRDTAGLAGTTPLGSHRTPAS